MPENEPLPFVEMQDISSSSHRRSSTPPPSSSDSLFRNLGSIIKVIAFILAFLIVVVSFVAAAFLFSTERLFMILSFGIVLVGSATALIVLFLIYGLGHVITQNDEILYRLKHR